MLPGPVRPGDLVSHVMEHLIERCPDGIALLDQDGRLLYVNEAGGRILGQPAGELVGTIPVSLASPYVRQAAPKALVEAVGGRPVRRQTVIMRPDGREREIECTDVAFEAEGRRMIAEIFRDVTDSRQAERWTGAFIQLSGNIAFAGSLEDVLEALARSVIQATRVMACAIVLFEEDGPPRFRVAGTHGLPSDYAQRFTGALSAGLDLPTVRAFESGDTVWITHLPDDPVGPEPATGDRPPWSAVVCVPMFARGRAVGVLKAYVQAAETTDAELTGFLRAIADQAAVALENARLFTEATQSARRRDALLRAGLALASELSLPAVAQKIVGLARDLADARYGVLLVLGSDGEPEDVVTSGYSKDQRPTISRLSGSQEVLSALLDEACPLRVGRIQDPRSVGLPADHPAISSLLAVPITVRGVVYGNLYLMGKRGALEFTEEDERILVTLGGQAGVTIENARLFEEAQDRLALEARSRLAGELHDSVSQALFAMTLEARATELVLERDGQDASHPIGLRLARLRELTEGALAEMRALIFELRPEALREEGLVAAVRKQAEGVAARGDLRVEIDAPQDRIALPVDVEEQMYRLAQEALTNVVRHADASRVVIRIRDRRPDLGELVVDIDDDGVGFDPSRHRPGHLGLRTMTHRAETLGGRLEIASTAGHGTAIRASAPIPPAEESGPSPA